MIGISLAGKILRDRRIIIQIGKKKIDGKGFSLLELLVVLVIISLMSAMIVPRIGGTIEKMNLRTAANKIAASLRYARSRAVSEKKIYVASFDFDENRMVLFVDSLRPEKIIEGQEVLPQIYNLPEGAKLEMAESIKGEEETELFEVYFYPSGNSSGGKIILAGEKNRRYTLNIDFITGTVKLVG